MHFKARGADEKARAAERVLFFVFAKDVADVLAQEALDAFAEFLHAVDIALVKLPLGTGPWLERRNLFVDLVIPGNVRNQVSNYREGFHRIDNYGLIERQRIHARLAHQARLP